MAFRRANLPGASASFGGGDPNAAINRLSSFDSFNQNGSINVTPTIT